MTDVAMESTGVYWKPVFNLLEPHVEVVVANAAHVKAVPGRKTERTRDATSLIDWLARTDASRLPEVRSFAAGIRRDRGAVEAALTSPWSNGQTEGQVNRLKALKRQMYGRAKLDLLRNASSMPLDRLHRE